MGYMKMHSNLHKALNVVDMRNMCALKTESGFTSVAQFGIIGDMILWGVNSAKDSLRFYKIF